MAKKGRSAFLLYYDWVETMQRQLEPTEAWNLLLALVDYSRYGTVPELEGKPAFAFEFMRGQIDRDNEKYQARCEQNAINGARGGRPKRETE